jgi:Xaa-Pro aminopeptidase
MINHSLRIPPSEFKTRAAKLLQWMQAQELAGVVLFDSVNALYFSGFAFIPTERPICFVMNREGERGMLVPRLELEHARTEADLEHVVHYAEYPGQNHPMNLLKELLADLGMLQGEGPLGADLNGYPWIFGYEGPALDALAGREVVLLQGALNRMQAVKSAAELALIRESCRWAHLAHTLLQRYTAVGQSETAVGLRASQEATLAMMDAIGPLYRSQDIWSSGPSAYYRGQIGRGAAIPHALANNITFQPGDVLVTGAACPVWGYNSELERTMFMGEPDQRRKALFQHMKTAQEIAFAAIKPGARCQEVDAAVRAYYDQEGLMPYWKHHSGHAIGLRYHEGPFLDVGDETVIREGMVFTVEPGLYDPEVGGFRHSDTVAVTADGIKIYTYYPRDWPNLVIPV